MWKDLGREYVGCVHFHYEILLDFLWWEEAPEVVVESLSEEGKGEYRSWKVFSCGVGFGILTIPVLALSSSVGCPVHNSIDLETILGPL